MTVVSVCVPAFEGAAWIGETLRSIQAQTHEQLAVEVAVDPSPAADDGTVAAAEPFLADPRFRLHLNPTRLGWAENIRSQLERVTTPYFIIVPHDDLIVPDYVESLLAVVEERPDAAVAYGDMTYFGADGGGRILDLPDAGRDEQLVAWFLAGGDAVPWRGVTRTVVARAAGGFPVDSFRGFLVECEYVLGLLLEARALRVPRPLYRKRLHPPEVVSASRRRVVEATWHEQRAAFEDHRSRMRARLERAEPPPSRVVRLASEARLLQRLAFHAASGGATYDADRETLERLIQETDAAPASAATARIRAMLDEVGDRHERVAAR